MNIKKILIILFLCVLVVGSVYYYNEQYKNVTDKTKTEKEMMLESETPEVKKCIEGYECIDIENTTYKFSIKRSIKVNNMFNYETNENEAGTLRIDDDGVLVFEDLTGKVIKKYDNIESKVVSIDSTKDKCDLVYVAITEDGKVYKTEEEDGLVSGEPFLMLPLDEDHFIINANTRAITIPSAFKKNGIAV